MSLSLVTLLDHALGLTLPLNTRLEPASVGDPVHFSKPLPAEPPLLIVPATASQ